MDAAHLHLLVFSYLLRLFIAGFLRHRHTTPLRVIVHVVSPYQKGVVVLETVWLYGYFSTVNMLTNTATGMLAANDMVFFASTVVIVVMLSEARRTRDTGQTMYLELGGKFTVIC